VNITTLVSSGVSIIMS